MCHSCFLFCHDLKELPECSNHVLFHGVPWVKKCSPMVVCMGFPATCAWFPMLLYGFCLGARGFTSTIAARLHKFSMESYNVLFNTIGKYTTILREKSCSNTSVIDLPMSHDVSNGGIPQRLWINGWHSTRAKNHRERQGTLDHSHHRCPSHLLVHFW